MRNTASRLGFIKDSEGTYRKGNFIFKDGKIMRESSIVPEGTIEDLKDDYVTLDECIRAVLAFPASIGEEPRTTNVYIDKSGKGFKVAKKLGKNTVAVVMSNRQVMDLKPRDIPEQTDTKALENKDKEDKPQKPKAIKSFAKPKELDKIKESAGKKIKLKESSKSKSGSKYLDALHNALDEGKIDEDTLVQNYNDYGYEYTNARQVFRHLNNKTAKEFMDDCGWSDIYLDYEEDMNESEKLKESDATPDFLNDLKDLCNKHCRVEIKDMRFTDDSTNFVEIEFPNGYTKIIDITADSNLAAISDIVRYLLRV